MKNPLGRNHLEDLRFRHVEARQDEVIKLRFLADPLEIAAILDFHDTVGDRKMFHRADEGQLVLILVVKALEVVVTGVDDRVCVRDKKGRCDFSAEPPKGTGGSRRRFLLDVIDLKRAGQVLKVGPDHVRLVVE